MQFAEMGDPAGKTLMLLPGTACDYQTNFGAVLERLGEKYHLICVNYDGFDGSDTIFPDMITVTEKIERYVKEKTRRPPGRSHRLLSGQQLRRPDDPAGKHPHRPRDLRKPGSGPERTFRRMASVKTGGSPSYKLYRE